MHCTVVAFNLICKCVQWTCKVHWLTGTLSQDISCHLSHTCHSSKCVKDNITRMTKLNKRKEEKVKNARIEHNKRRADEHSKRYDRVLYSTYAPIPVGSKHFVLIRHLP